MSVYKRGEVWWYRFQIKGQLVRESSHSPSKTVARDAESARRRRLELAINGISRRRDRMPLFSVGADEWHKGRVGLAPRSLSRYEQCLAPLKAAFRDRLVCDIDEQDIRDYQRKRLADGLTGRSVNYETGTLRQILKSFGLWGPLADRVTTLKENHDVGKAISAEDEKKLLQAAQQSRSPAILPLLVVSLDTGLRAAEIKALRLRDLLLVAETDQITSGKLVVPKSKTEFGTGRAVPFTRRVCAVLSLWLSRFPTAGPDSYVFPFHRIGLSGHKREPVMWDMHLDRPMREWKNAWAKVCHTAGVRYRWHDCRHTFVSRLAENPAVSEETIRSLAGHVSRKMLERYSHIREQARKAAIEMLENQTSGTPVLGQGGHKIGHTPETGENPPAANPFGMNGGPTRT